MSMANRMSCPREKCALGLLFALALFFPHPANAAIQPCTADSATLHLWRLDETSTPCVDAAPGGATLGNASFSNSAVNFKNSISFGALAATSLASRSISIKTSK